MIPITELPFFYKSNADPGNGGEPETLPFHLYFDDDLKMFRQKSTSELEVRLFDVYLKGSLADGSISSESGKVYIDRILAYLFKHFNFKNDSKILEIGFGSGIILKKLTEHGIENLSGIDPGNHSRVSGLENINLVTDFFPSTKIQGKFDLIFSFLVLEHIEDPLEYLKNIISQLAENGKIIIGVPNCGPYIEEGDLSMFIHEHFNYFTAESIIHLVSKVNFKIEDLSVIEGSFVITISKNGKINQLTGNPVSQKQFYEKVETFLKKFTTLTSEYQKDNLVIYAPIRAMNALFLTGKKHFRLVDDNSELHNRYLPFLSSSVESFDEMAKKPPGCILIFSRTFAERIKKKCESDPRLKNVRVLTLSDLN